MTISRQMRVILTVLTFVLLVVAVGAFYLVKIKPLETQISSLEESIKVEQDVIAQLESNNEKRAEETTGDTTDLQKRLPVIDNMEQFLLMLEEAEVVSKSLIRNVSFSKSTIEVPEESTTLEEDIEQLEEENQEFNDTTADIQEKGATEAVEGQEEGKVQPVILPSGVERLTANLTIEADHYFEIAAFVRSIEGFERIANIDNIQFTGMEEVTNLSNFSGDQVLTYSMAVSTYFFPTLEEFKDQAPKYDPAEPGNKDNPFYQFGEVPKIWRFKNNIENEPYEELTDENGSTYHVYEYVVDKNDTLDEISNVIYGNKAGKETLKVWNQLKSESLQRGARLKIPIEVRKEAPIGEDLNLGTGANINSTNNEINNTGEDNSGGSDATNQTGDNKDNTASNKTDDTKNTAKAGSATKPVNPPYEEVEVEGVNYHVYEHKVVKGESLFKLSVQYYKNANNIETIKNWNGLKSYQINVGDTLKIPREAEYVESIL